MLFSLLLLPVSFAKRQKNLSTAAPWGWSKAHHISFSLCALLALRLIPFTNADHRTRRAHRERRSYGYFAIVSSLVYSLFFTAYLPQAAQAQEIYRWQDESGRIYYSDSPRDQNDKPVALPDLTKEDLDGKIDKIKSETPPNCEKHGGVDCNKGPDIDGSVICLDGFTDAILPFRFRCMEVRLEAEYALAFGEEQVEPVSNKKKIGSMLNGRAPSALWVTLRNMSAVEAFGVSVTFVFPGTKQKPLPAIGPERIPAYGLAEYSASLKGLEQPLTEKQWQEASYKAYCTNCSLVATKPN
jgi:hypothetical protein